MEHPSNSTFNMSDPVESFALLRPGPCSPLEAPSLHNPYSLCFSDSSNAIYGTAFLIATILSFTGWIDLALVLSYYFRYTYCTSTVLCIRHEHG